MIALTVIIFVSTIFIDILLITNKEKQKQQELQILEHSYIIGYYYLRSQIINADSLLGGGQLLVIKQGFSSQEIRKYGDKVNRYIENNPGVINVFQFVEHINFEILPQQMGIRMYGKLKKGGSTLDFDEVILRKKNENDR